MELRPSEQLIRIHRFRFLMAAGCGQTGIDLVVEEALEGLPAGAPRCSARPDHRELVPKPEFTQHGETVEDALRNCLATIRPRKYYELFLPTA